MYRLHSQALNRLALEGAVDWDLTSTKTLPSGSFHRVQVVAVEGNSVIVEDFSGRSMSIPAKEFVAAKGLHPSLESQWLVRWEWRLGERVVRTTDGRWALLSAEGEPVSWSNRSHTLMSNRDPFEFAIHPIQPVEE
jgi:hypothetical protein